MEPRACAKGTREKKEGERALCEGLLSLSLFYALCIRKDAQFSPQVKPANLLTFDPLESCPCDIV